MPVVPRWKVFIPSQVSSKTRDLRRSQLGMLMQKRRDCRDQLLAGKGHRRGQAQRSPQRPALIASAGENIPQLTKRLVELRHQPQSVVAEAHAAGGAMDEGFDLLFRTAFNQVKCQ